MHGRRFTSLVAAALVLFLMPMTARCQTAAPAAAERLAPADEWVPPQAFAVLSVPKPKALLDWFLRPQMIQAITSSPLYKAASASPKFRELQTGIDMIEKRFSADWQTLVRRFTEGGATLAVGPDKTSLLILDARDAQAANDLHELVLQLARGGAADKGQADPVTSSQEGDVTVWIVGGQQTHAVIGKRLVFADRPAVMQAALSTRSGDAQASIAGSAEYKAARQAAGDAQAVLWVNSGLLKLYPPVAQALSAESNPLIALLAAPITDAMKQSTWLAMALRVKDDTITLEALSDGTISPEGAARFALPAKGGQGPMPNLAVPRRLAAMSLYRDLRGFYAAKDKLFPERTSGLIFFENMMGIFFTGRDLTEEVLAETGPDIRLVAAEQTYDPEIAVPAVKIPAFALVLRMKNPKRFSLVMEEAWQKALGLINFTRGQQALPGLIIDRVEHKGVKYTVASFAPAPAKERAAAEMRFNFRPALAAAGEFIILSSTAQLAEDIMDALAKEASAAAKPLAQAHSLLEVEGAQLASILAANRETLVRQNMVNKGNTKEQAEGEVGVLLDLLKVLGGARLEIGALEGKFLARLQVRVNLPPAQTGEK